MIQVQYESTIKLMVKILNRINQYQFCKNKYLSIQRKLIFVHLIQNINKDIKLKNSTEQFPQQRNQITQQCESECPILRQSISRNLCQYPANYHFTNISKYLKLKPYHQDILNQKSKIRCQFLGYFNIQKILRFKDQLETPFQLLFESYDLNQETLQFIFPHSIDIPFNHC